MHHLLNLLIWLPIIGGVFVFLTGDDKNPNMSRYLSLFIVLHREATVFVNLEFFLYFCMFLSFSRADCFLLFLEYF